MNSDIGKPFSDKNSMRTSPALSRKAVLRIWLLKYMSLQLAIIDFSNIAVFLQTYSMADMIGHRRRLRVNQAAARKSNSVIATTLVALRRSSSSRRSSAFFAFDSGTVRGP